MDIEVLGIDLGKTVCSLAGLDATGAVVFRKRLQRHRLLDFLEGLRPCVVAMEACGGAHHIGRFCLKLGHEPRLMSPLYVRPYVKVHKNDDRDAQAIAEAATRPTMSFVTIKSEEQLDLQALHRARERLVTERTRLINQGRGFLMERGIRVGTGPERVDEIGGGRNRRSVAPYPSDVVGHGDGTGHDQRPCRSHRRRDQCVG